MFVICLIHRVSYNLCKTIYTYIIQNGCSILCDFNFVLVSKKKNAKKYKKLFKNTKKREKNCLLYYIVYMTPKFGMNIRYVIVDLMGGLLLFCMDK